MSSMLASRHYGRHRGTSHQLNMYNITDFIAVILEQSWTKYPLQWDIPVFCVLHLHAKNKEAILVNVEK